MKEEVKKIYFDEELNVLPTYYNRDIIKVLLINPKSVYVLWGISQNSYDSIANKLQANREDLFFRLIIHYKSEDRASKSRIISLPPFTNNWFVDFTEKTKDIKAEIIAYTNAGSTYSLLHSAEISLPSSKPSLQIHQDWTHPTWFHFSDSVEIKGETFLTEKKNKSEITNSIQENKFISNEFNPFSNPEQSFFSPDGSSGLMGSGSTWKSYE